MKNEGKFCEIYNVILVPVLLIPSNPFNTFLQFVCWLWTFSRLLDPSF